MQKYKLLNPILNFLDYEYEEEKCKRVYSSISNTGFLKYFLFSYLFFLNLFGFIKLFIKANTNFIFFNFISGIVILIFESDSKNSIDTKKKFRNKNYEEKIYDIAVVGSGPGGSIASLRSIENGSSVILIGRISNFGLLEMSRQRLRESAIKWKITLTDESFAQKLLKIVELKAVINKAKFVELKVCEKISDFLKENFVNDLTYFEKKNKMKIDIISDNSFPLFNFIDSGFKGESKIGKCPSGRLCRIF